MKQDPNKLKELHRKASDALFDLHDYMRRAGEADGDDFWRQVYGFRVQLGMLIDSRMKYWEHRREVWMGEIRAQLEGVNMDFGEWQERFPFDFEAEWQKGTNPYDTASAANRFWWSEQNKALPEGHPAKRKD